MKFGCFFHHDLRLFTLEIEGIVLEDVTNCLNEIKNLLGEEVTVNTFFFFLLFSCLVILPFPRNR